MKNEEAGGMGTILLTTLTSDIRRGRADTAPSSSSFTNSSISQLSGNIITEQKETFLVGFVWVTITSSSSSSELLSECKGRKGNVKCLRGHQEGAESEEEEDICYINMLVLVSTNIFRKLSKQSN